MTAAITESKVRRPLAQALADAEAFRALFPPASYERWEIAGSVRRRAADCGDVDHVVIPASGEVLLQGGLFPVKETRNLLWHHLDTLWCRGVVSKHIYGPSGFRWGEKLRGVDFRGHNHEVACVDAGNWGAALAIKTGPAEFSKKLVWEMRLNGRRNHLGRVWQCRTCECVNPHDCGAGCDESCRRCQGTGLVPVEEIAVPEETEYFRLCGLPFVPPEERGR